MSKKKTMTKIPKNDKRKSRLSGKMKSNADLNQSMKDKI